MLSSRSVILSAGLGFGALTFGPGCSSYKPPSMPAVEEVKGYHLMDGDFRRTDNGFWIYNESNSYQEAVNFPVKLRTFLALNPNLRLREMTLRAPQAAIVDNYDVGARSFSVMLRFDEAKTAETIKYRVYTFGPGELENQYKELLKPPSNLKPVCTCSLPEGIQLSRGKSTTIHSYSRGHVAVLEETGEKSK